MFKFIKNKAVAVILAGIFALLIPAGSIAADKEVVSTDDPLLTAMLAELKRTKENLRLPEQPAPYFISFWIQESATASISGKTELLPKCTRNFTRIELPTYK